MKSLSLASLLLLFATLTLAQVRATTADGRAVMLHPDGTWTAADSARADTVVDFRRARWGMSQADVRARESDSLVQESENLLVYADTLADLACRIRYVFAEGKLVETGYTITEKHDNKNGYVVDFEGLKELLRTKYGKPATTKTKWINEYYKGQPQYRGLAASMGHLRQWAEWETPRSSIHLELAGQDFEPELFIRYTSRKLKAAQEQDERAKRLEEF